MSKISIVIPVYNSEKYLDECLNSVINQTYKDLEIIIINDGSVDNSEFIIKKYKSIDDRIIVKKIKNHGVSYARNLGITIASGKYISFVDSDDYLNLNMYEKLLNSIENFDMIICGWDEINFNNRTKKYLLNKQWNIKEIFKSNEKNLYRYINPPWNKLIKLDIIKKNNLFFYEDMCFGEDYIFNINLFNYCNKIKSTADILYNYRVLNSGLNQKNLYDISKYWSDKKKIILNLKYINTKNINITLDKLIENELVNSFVNSLNIKADRIKKNKVLNEIRDFIQFEKKSKKSSIKNRIILFLIKYKLYFLIKILYLFKNIL